MILVIFLPAVASPQADNAVEDAVAEIQKAGGTVTRGESLPGKPVVQVYLTACTISPEAFAKIRFLTQLKSLDL